MPYECLPLHLMWAALSNRGHGNLGQQHCTQPVSPKGQAHSWTERSARTVEMQPHLLVGEPPMPGRAICTSLASTLVMFGRAGAEPGRLLVKRLPV